MQVVSGRHIIGVEELHFRERYSNSMVCHLILNRHVPSDGIPLNDQVEHPIFGKGAITEVDACSRTYVVKFEGMEILKPISFDFKRMVKLKRY